MAARGRSYFAACNPSPSRCGDLARRVAAACATVVVVGGAAVAGGVWLALHALARVGVLGRLGRACVA